VFGAATNDPEHYSHLLARDAQAYQERTRAFDAFGWFREAGKNLTFAGQPHHIQGVRVTPALVRQLGVDPVLGQWFQDETGVVISTSLWRRLGSDPGIIGRPHARRTGYVAPASPFSRPSPESRRRAFTPTWMASIRGGGGGCIATAAGKPGITLPPPRRT
jgi:hypothetical protein